MMKIIKPGSLSWNYCKPHLKAHFKCRVCKAEFIAESSDKGFIRPEYNHDYPKFRCITDGCDNLIYGTLITNEPDFPVCETMKQERQKARSEERYKYECYCCGYKWNDPVIRRRISENTIQCPKCLEWVIDDW